MREDLDKARLRVGPVLQNPRRARAAGQVAMAFQQYAHLGHIRFRIQRLQIDAGLVASPRGEVALLVVDKGAPPLMPAAKLRPVLPMTTTVPLVMYSQPWSPTPSTTAMAPELRTAEALAGDAVQEDFAAGCAVEHHVAHQDALFGQEA